MLGTAAPTLQAATTIWDDPTALVVLLYLGGVAMIAGRLLAGLWTLRRWTRAATPATDPAWTEALERATAAVQLAHAPRLLVSHAAHSPLSWGWRRPVILIDRDSYDLAEDAEAILAHEVAHVARGDWLTLVLARAAVALFWFNPLVWLVERVAMDEAEEAADCHAIAAVEPARYAQTLLNYAQQAGGSPLPANCIVSGGLSRRVRAILGGRLGKVPSGSLWARAAIAASVGIAAPVAALKLIAPAPPVPAAPLPPMALVAPAKPVMRVAPAATIQAPAAPQAPTAPVIATAVSAPPSPAAVVTPPAPPAPPGPPAHLALARDIEGSFAHLGAEIAAEVRAAVHASASAVHADLIAIRVARETERAMAASERSFRRGMEQGANGMERGALSMEAGARHMREEAERLRSRDYRERKIAEAAARGRTVTHEELIEAISDLKDGSRDMIEGASEMRREAAEMRRQRMN
jgi:beta-lactamase regulating signal transducer with metallopeptidase domain